MEGTAGLGHHSRVAPAAMAGAAVRGGGEEVDREVPVHVGGVSCPLLVWVPGEDEVRVGKKGRKKQDAHM